MANVFSGMSSAAWDPWSKNDRSLDADTLAWLRANPDGGDFRGYRYRPQNTGGDGGGAESWSGGVQNKGTLQQYNRIALDDSGNQIGRDFEAYDPSGKYTHSWIESKGTWMDKNGWILPLAMAGIANPQWFGLGGGTAGTAGMTASELAALFPGEGMLSGIPAWDAAAKAAGLTLSGTAGAATGLSSVASAADKIVSAAKAAGTAVSDFLGTGAGKALVSALGPLAGAAVASALTKKASAPDPDPMMKDAAAGAKGVADKATGRADAQDAYFNSTFMPQYLEMMKRADARDTELYDFNMGRARLAANQMDKFYEMVDSYDSEGERTKRRGEAIATVQQRDAAMMSGASRDLQRMGVNPNSGVWASNLRQMGQQSALNQAMAANMVGEAARREGINLRAQAAGMRGADGSYAAGALAGSGLGMAGVTGAQNGWGANNAGWNSTTGLGLTGYGQLGTYGTAMTGYRNQANIANVTGRNQMMGMGLGFGLNALFGAGGMFGPGKP